VENEKDIAAFYGFAYTDEQDFEAALTRAGFYIIGEYTVHREKYQLQENTQVTVVVDHVTYTEENLD